MTYLRDDFPHLPWPGCWDLPGGGREGAESAEVCLLREVQEEFGLTLPESRLEHRLRCPAMIQGQPPGIFFAGRITAREIAAIRFGSEGQRWQMMAVRDYLSHPRAIPALVQRVARVAVLYGVAV